MILLTAVLRQRCYSVTGKSSASSKRRGCKRRVLPLAVELDFLSGNFVRRLTTNVDAVSTSFHRDSACRGRVKRSDGDGLGGTEATVSTEGQPKPAAVVQQLNGHRPMTGRFENLVPPRERTLPGPKCVRSAQK